MDRGNEVTLPLSARSYPDSNYMFNSVHSPAETISYWLERVPR